MPKPISHQDFVSKQYYPFEMVMPGRGFTAGSAGGYRFGFNGQEIDNSIKDERNSLDFGARMFDPRIGKWISVDPSYQKYASICGYSFVQCNPIWGFDPNGKEVYFYGEDAQESISKLQSMTSLKLIYNTETGMLTAVGDPKSDIDNALLSATTSQSITTRIITTTVDKVGDANLVGAINGGSNIVTGADGTNTVITTQYINLNHLLLEEEAGLNSAGQTVLHELLESYFGGEIHPGALEETEGRPAHNKAISLDKNWIRVYGAYINDFESRKTYLGEQDVPFGETPSKSVKLFEIKGEDNYSHFDFTMPLIIDQSNYSPTPKPDN